MMKSVADILAAKGREVFSISPDTSLIDALSLMARHKVGALLVLEGERPVGIISERDVARGIVEKPGVALDSFRASDLMTARVAYVQLRHTLEECMALMTDKRIRHLPVLEGEALAGMISIGDVVKAMIDDKEFLIAQLENYITGR